MSHLIKNRLKLIRRYVENKEVLDFGSVGSRNEEIFNELKKINKSIAGIDMQKSKKNKEIVQGNAETHNFKRKFDVVMMGDILEHVSNQGLLLDNARRHLKLQGILILTTPNLRSAWIFQKQREDHVLGHVKETLVQLLTRHKFRVKELRYYSGNKKYPFFLTPFILNRQFLVVAERAE